MKFFDLTPPAPSVGIESEIKDMLLRIRERVAESPHVSEESRKNTLECCDRELEQLQGVSTPESSV